MEGLLEELKALVAKYDTTSVTMPSDSGTMADATVTSSTVETREVPEPATEEPAVVESSEETA